MNFPVSSEHSCTEVCARTTVRKAQGARRGQGFYHCFSKKTKQQITPGNTKSRNQSIDSISAWPNKVLMLKHPHSCKWLFDLWDTDKNRKLNPWSRSGTASAFHQVPAALYLCSRTEQWNEAAKQHLGSMSRSQLVSLCSHTKKKKVKVFFQSCLFKFKLNQKWFHLKW